MKKFFKNITPISQSFLKDKPLTFKGAISHWPALHKWTDSYLINNIQNNNAPNFFEFNKHSQRNKIHGHTAQSAFSQVLQGDSSQRYYLTLQPLLHKEKILLEDIQTPAWIKEKKFHMPNIWVGQKMSLTPLHYDSTDGYLCQIAGYKKVYLFSPQDSLYLYPGTPLSSGHFNLSEITHLHDVSFENYPHFLHATIHSVVLSPGDALYIPQGWWHQVFNLSQSKAVNFFFTNEVRGYSPKQEILMYQACKSPGPSKINDIVSRRNYGLCIENAFSLLELNCLDYACYFALTYFEEYLKAHLASLLFSKFSQAENELGKKIHDLVSDLYNTRQSDREKYYNNLLEANDFLKTCHNKVHIPNHMMNKLVELAKNILLHGAAHMKPKEVNALINDIKMTCIYKLDQEQEIKLNTNQYKVRP